MNYGDSREKLIQLLTTDGELKMSGENSSLLVVTGCVTGPLEDLNIEVFKEGHQVDWGAFPLPILVLIGTSGSGPFNGGVGAQHPASGGHFWPPEQNRRWPEVGSRKSDFYSLFFDKVCYISY